MKFYTVAKDELHEYRGEKEPYEHIVVITKDLRALLEKKQRERECKAEETLAEINEVRVLKRLLDEWACFHDSFKFMISQRNQADALKELLAELESPSFPVKPVEKKRSRKKKSYFGYFKAEAGRE